MTVPRHAAGRVVAGFGATVGHGGTTPMIDIRKLKELVRLMVANELSELDLRDSEEQVTLRRPSGGGAPVATLTPAAAVPVPAAPVCGVLPRRVAPRARPARPRRR